MASGPDSTHGIGLRLYPLIAKTGLPSYHTVNLKKSIYEVLLRMLYTPFSQSLNTLLKSIQKLENSINQEYSHFYKQSKEVESMTCIPRIRPTKCMMCGILKSKQEFPREDTNLLVNDEFVSKIFMNLKICFSCHGYENPMLQCCSKKCDYTGDCFQLNVKSTCTTYSNCIDVKHPGRIHCVPPKYNHLIAETNSQKGGETNETNETIVLGRKIFTKENQLDIKRIVNESKLENNNMRMEDYVQICVLSGLLSKKENAILELTNLLCLMIYHVEYVPAWKFMVDNAMEDKRKTNEKFLALKFRMH